MEYFFIHFIVVASIPLVQSIARERCVNIDFCAASCCLSRGLPVAARGVTAGMTHYHQRITNQYE